MTSAEIPSRFGHYEIERPLGRGAIGTVYAARDVRIGRRVALKTIQLPDAKFEDGTSAREFFKRLQREAEVSGSLLHPNIVTLYEVAYENERVSYLAMELVDGETLFDLMKRFRPEPVPVETTMRIAIDILRGLAHAHEKGIVHRDIKPANILVAADGSAKIADFGIARPEQSSMTAAGSLVGTPNYMSPEQVTGAQLTPRADLFSLGVVLYEMLTAAKPFAGSDITAVLHNILRVDPPHVSNVNPSVPRPVGDFIGRLMAKAPSARPSADEALSVAERVLRPASSDRHPALPIHPLRRPVPWPIAAGMLVAAVLAAVIPVIAIVSRTDDTASVSLPPARVAEFEAKRRALLSADALFAEQKFEEAAEAYKAYLSKYPHATAAADGHARALAAIEEKEKAVAAQAARRRRSARDEDISPRELLDRIRRVIRK